MSRALTAVVVTLALGSPTAALATSYQVKPGDSLTAIARAHGTTVAALARLNHLDPGAVLPVGVQLRLSERAAGARVVPYGRYRVRAGDSLTAIGSRFGTTATELARANRMTLAETLLVGAVLRVPRAPTPATTAPATAASTAYRSYVVRAGDTLTAIALGAGMDLDALATLNHVSLGAPLLVGTSLRVPSAPAGNPLTDGTATAARSSIVHWASHYQVDVKLALAVAWMESGFNNTLVSPAGALGVMQVTPDTWDYVESVLLLGRTIPRTQDGNVRVGVAFLHHLLHIYAGDEQKALASYYQGARSYETQGLLPGTQQYIDDILALKSRF